MPSGIGSFYPDLPPTQLYADAGTLKHIISHDDVPTWKTQADCQVNFNHNFENHDFTYNSNGFHKNVGVVGEGLHVSIWLSTPKDNSEFQLLCNSTPMRTWPIRQGLQGSPLIISTLLRLHLPILAYVSGITLWGQTHCWSVKVFIHRRKVCLHRPWSGSRL